MSSLWTPDGEHRVGRESPPGNPAAGPPAGPAGGAGPDADAFDAFDDMDDLSPEDREALAARLDELRSQLMATPAEVVIANHAYGLFELAAIHLSQQPPLLEQARLAVDALGAVVGALTGRLGEAEPSLHDALAQIRLTFVQIAEMVKTPPADGAADGSAGGGGT
ncbi:MAG TPA: hypothetical protein VNC61_11405 [Acidimicrobiales bacterium]|nr:hypothetical protein [Acidimicrobiales bacterium]